ncbi:MAG: TonB-dependent receptor, partial [Bacteroidota bacterium]|nr:TonB-dependent receptor [Bacteroidota bacterium]
QERGLSFFGYASLHQLIPSATLFLLFLLTTVHLFAQKTISGTVRDDKGQPMTGVSVLVKGSTTGVNTDAQGRFTITAPENSTLVFSSVGFSEKEIPISGRSSFDVQMGTAAAAMDEVVVVGYGTQRKANLTGSVSSVSGATLTNRPAPNAANLLQGRVSGLQVTQPSAEPGRDNPSFLIRGRGSFSGGTANAPLVLIDGVVGSLNNLSPDDIENVTVLKDAASASIYGSRAANGVILVTTRKGRRGQATVSYRVNVARHTAIGLPDLITNSAEYMEMYNAAAKRSGLSPTTYYPQAEIDKYRNATDRNQYPNFDAIDYWFRPAWVTNHNLSVSGGGEKSTYNLSLNYLDQPAVLPWYKFKRYNALLNYSTQIGNAVTVGTIINGTYKDRREPPVTSQFMALTVYATGPLYGPYLPDGSGRVVTRAYNFEGRNRNVSEYPVMGEQFTKEYNLNAQAYMDVKVLKGLTWSSKVAVNYTDEYFKMHQVPYNTYLLQERDPATGDYKLFNPFGPDILGVTDQYTKVINPTLYSTLTYDTRIKNDHSLRVLAGYEQLSYRYQSLRARRVTSVAPALTELTGYSATGEAVYFFAFPTNHPRLPSISAPFEWALQSVFGRVNYSYKDKYLLETNLRYDGTSKVSPEFRWGLFPSVSAGWLISEENFLRDKINWLSNLKLRASYGTLGNQDIGTYLYQNVFATNVAYPFGNTGPLQGAVVNEFRDQSLRWESTRIADVGFDLNIRRGLLGVSFDWFRKTTYNILATQPVPFSLGLNAPTFNNGKMRNQGVELELTHQNRIGEVTYGVNALFSTANNKVLAISVPSRGTTIRDVGYPYDAHFLYVWDGIFQVEDTVRGKVPRHQLNPNPKPGDLKMKDVDGDGDVDADDRVVVKGAYPDFTYSFGLNAGYKGFSLNAFFQGVKGLQNRITGWGVDPFTQGTAPTPKWRDAWTEQNRSNTLPAIYAGSYVGVTSYQGSTFYLQNASYLRLKNIVLSYTFPKAVFSRIKAKDLNVYVSADNLFTITKYEVGDPERADISSNFPPYPQTRILNIGLNVKF